MKKRVIMLAGLSLVLLATVGTDTIPGDLHVNGISRFDGGYLILKDGATLTGYFGDAVNLGFGKLTNEDLVMRGVDGIGFTTNDGQTDAMYINSAGNVGIRTTDPQNHLHVNGTSRFDGGYLILKDGATLTGYFGDAVNLGFGKLTNEDLVMRGVDGIGFTTNDGQTDAMYINSAGNVGLGTINPAAMLHVAGDLQVDGNVAAKFQP